MLPSLRVSEDGALLLCVLVLYWGGLAKLPLLLPLVTLCARELREASMHDVTYRAKSRIFAHRVKAHTSACVCHCYWRLGLLVWGVVAVVPRSWNAGALLSNKWDIALCCAGLYSFWLWRW